VRSCLEKVMSWARSEAGANKVMAQKMKATVELDRTKL
jgi:hypothetical protein